MGDDFENGQIMGLAFPGLFPMASQRIFKDHKLLLWDDFKNGQVMTS